MFGSKKRLQEIEQSKQQLEKEKQKLLCIKQQIEKEKQELLFIQEQLEDTTPKVDVSNIYVWKDNGLYSIVKLDIEDIIGTNLYGNLMKAYRSTLIDIFSNQVVYEKQSTEKILGIEKIYSEDYRSKYNAYLNPIYCVDKNLLAYTDKKVPLYVLKQLYYKLNNVDVNSHVLRKEK